MPRKSKTQKEYEVAQQEVQSFIEDYPNVELAAVHKAEDGQHRIVFKPSLATLDPIDAQWSSKLPKEIKRRLKASTLYRDELVRSDLDLVSTDATQEAPKKLYRKMREYYRSKDVFGAYIDVLVNMSISGFDNDCEDLKLKEFFDNWCEDIDIMQVLEWIFQEFYTTGFVNTYKVLGKYEPQVNRLPALKGQEPKAPRKLKSETKEEYLLQKKLWEAGAALEKIPEEDWVDFAARKKRWSKGYVPIAYTILNPEAIEIVGSMMFNQNRVMLEPTEDMVELVQKEDMKSPLTDTEKKLLDELPPEIKTAIKKQEPVELDPDLVGQIRYRSMPWERYAIPKGARAIEALELKEAFRHADWSAIDGIVSEVMVITIGDKDNPVLKSEDLSKVAALFNHPQKAFNVVWNHTLKVERITANNIDQIFGVAKYEQVERDISGSFGVPRAIVDGIMYGDFNKDSMSMAMESLIAELQYARRQVERWILREYKQIAEAFGFERVPSVRWNTMILKDELAFKTLVQGLVDRRIISYDTAHKLLGFEPLYERKKMSEEVNAVVDGTLGLHGSPYQQPAASSPAVQKTQKTPKGTPSEGRPKNTPAPKTPTKSTPKGQTDEKLKKAAMVEMLKGMTIEEIVELEKMFGMAREKKTEELINFITEREEIVEDS